MNIFSQEDLDILRNLPEVVGSTASTFTVTLPERIQQVLLEKWGLRVTRVPFRRMEGDTTPHVDVGSQSFQNTYLAYLTDGEGTLEIGDASYPITAGTGFVFPNGTRHGVVGTNGSSRLMLGPMSEAGLAVGGPSILYIRQNGANQEYSYDQSTWQVITWPLNIGGGIEVNFTTDLTLTSQTSYFICGASNIIIGSRFLKNDGTRVTITIDGVIDYPGLVQNDGNNNIKIYNIHVASVGGSYLASGAGWIGGYRYGRSGGNNIIYYCSSDGSISPSSGGIVGAEAASKVGPIPGDLTIVGCSSSGSIGDSAGGIAGESLGLGGGAMVIRKCWSTGTIGNNAGGIVGRYACKNTGFVIVEVCYSMGAIGQEAGGIVGKLAGEGSTVIAASCYSRGTIGTDAGGIFGSQAGTMLGNVVAFGCYSNGILSGGNGIFGASPGNASTENCYIANGAWNTNAATLGLGPAMVNYISPSVNTPFLLRNFGPSPYSLETVLPGATDLVYTYSETVAASVPSSPGVTAGYTYSLLSGSGSISALTGAITVAIPGSYTYIVLATDGSSYSVTTVNLTVTGDVPPPTPVPVRIEPRGKGYDFSIYNDVQVGKRLVQERLQNQNIRFKSFEDYHKYKMALLRNNLG